MKERQSTPFALFGPSSDREPEDEEDANEYSLIMQRGSRRVSIDYDARKPGQIELITINEGRPTVNRKIIQVSDWPSIIKAIAHMEESDVDLRAIEKQ